jgi:hypothetical protein
MYAEILFCQRHSEKLTNVLNVSRDTRQIVGHVPLTTASDGKLMTVKFVECPVKYTYVNFSNLYLLFLKRISQLYLATHVFKTRV